MKVTTHQALGFLFFFRCNANMDNLVTHSLELLSDGPPETSSSGSEHSISTALPDQRGSITITSRPKEIDSVQPNRHGLSHNQLPATDRAKLLSHPGTSSSPARSTNYNPPVIDLTVENPHSAEMKDLVGDQAPTKAPGMNAGSRRKISGYSGKRDERTELATTQNSQPSEVPVPVDVEGRPPKIIKLMGAFMGTEVRPDRIDSDGTIKRSDPFNQGYHVPGSTEASNTADRGKHIAQTLSITDAGSSNLERIPARIMTLESTGSSLKELLIDVERQSQNTQTSRTKDEPRQRLKFTEDVLDFSNTPAEYQSHFLDALGEVLFDLKANELVMTEAQFIIYHTDFYRIYQRSELAPHSDSKTNIPYGKKSQAYKHMLEHKDKWYSHWQTLMTQINLESSTDKLLLKSKELVLPYLFYVEMISTVVPIAINQNNLGTHLKEAWDLLESIFGKETVADGKQAGRGKIYEKFGNYERFNSLGLASKVSALWDLLELWLDTHRPTLSDEIRAFGRTLHTIKAFFNSLFFLSVENLTKKISQ
ncbi:hypothetical protein PGT21_034084 [Puccinia graminis f. sp. tritici]|uniref:Uncharacterized protein n=1 Tax=Puccinia graminis f. sp. tritici TaxID=56615 RepID=A0A5B0PZW8_PUCGR|nr:hypothetical protein PGT21_034084 [Puccinia graminis f. sp. tritici]KAA1109430.1 hypothetical protein PGTUg99_033179 [Puccinia graminis f. sp. tritici]